MLINSYKVLNYTYFFYYTSSSTSMRSYKPLLCMLWLKWVQNRKENQSKLRCWSFIFFSWEVIILIGLWASYKCVICLRKGNKVTWLWFAERCLRVVIWLICSGMRLMWLWSTMRILRWGKLRGIDCRRLSLRFSSWVIDRTIGNSFIPLLIIETLWMHDLLINDSGITRPLYSFFSI